jgi:mitochondrial import inner membrane translocase subunit TIM50
VKTHPENAIIVPKWKGEPGDKGLIALIPFLECKALHVISLMIQLMLLILHTPALGIYKPSDVRPILEAYRGKDIPIEYARKEAEAKQRHLEEWQASGGGKGVGRITFSSLFGGASGPVCLSCSACSGLLADLHSSTM